MHSLAIKSVRVKLLISVLLVLLAIRVSQAQQWPSEVWHEGKVVLLSGDTLRGLVKYDLQQDLVQHAFQERKAEVYTARKVLFFEIFDNSVHQYRQFFALPFNTAGGYKAPVFFELLSEGKMTLLAREYLEYKTYSSPYYIGAYSRLVLSHKYFFLKEDGSIDEFIGNRNDLLDQMGKQAEDVEKYIKSNRLRFDDKYDLARIITYYNSFFKT